MSFDSLIDAAGKYLSGHLNSLSGIFMAPSKTFSNLAMGALGGGADEPISDFLRGEKELLVFSLINIFIGSTLNRLIPGRSLAADFNVVAIVIICYWLLLSTVIHGLCRILRGKAPFAVTVIVATSTFSATYIAASAASFLFSIPLRWWSSDHDLVVILSLCFYLSFQCALILYILPRALSGPHGFGWVRQTFVSVGAAVCFIVLAVMTSNTTSKESATTGTPALASGAPHLRSEALPPLKCVGCRRKG